MNLCSLLPSPVWPLPIYLDLWTLHSRFLWNIVLYSIRLYFCHQTHVQMGIVFTLALTLHSSEVISLLFSSSILDTYGPGEFICQSHFFFSFSYCLGGSQGKNAEVVFPFLSLVDHILSELSPMTWSSWINYGGLEICALIFSCENTKIGLSCWITIDRRMLGHTKYIYSLCPRKN